MIKLYWKIVDDKLREKVTSSYAYDYETATHLIEKLLINCKSSKLIEVLDGAPKNEVYDCAHITTLMPLLNYNCKV